MRHKHNHEKEKDTEQTEETTEETTEEETEEEQTEEETEEEPSVSDRLKALLLVYKAGGGNNAESRNALNSIVDLLVNNQ